MPTVREKVVTFKVSDEELEMVKRGADSEGKNMSDYCRACVIRDRLMEKDPTAIKIFRESLSGYVKAKEEAFEEALSGFFVSFRDRITAVWEPRSGKRK